MIKKIINCWIRHKTKNLTRIPLFTMTFDYRKYKADGKKDSCMFYAHPNIARDISIITVLWKALQILIK